MAERWNNRELHTWVEERLSDYMDDRMEPLERVQLERHLTDCARCQRALKSLQWTVSLVKSAPAPKLPRSFMIPVPASAPRPPIFGLSALRLATALATLILVSLIGVDLIFQFGGSGSRAAPQAGVLSVPAGPPTSVALLPEAAATQPASKPVLPAAVPPTSAPLATSAPAAATLEPQPPAASGLASGPAATAAPPGPLPLAVTPSPSPSGQARMSAQPSGPRATPTLTAPLGLGGGAPPETRANKALSDTLAPTATASATPTVPLPTLAPSTPTLIVPTATHTPQLQVLVVPTSDQGYRSSQTETPSGVVTPVRIAELGALFVAVFLGASTLLLSKRR